jgi:aquaporin Z
LVGTFVLVFVGTGAIVINDVSGGQVTHVGVALAFGLAVLTMVFAVGGVSGAHLNPAVSLGLAIHGQTGWRPVPIYMLAQSAGAVLASLLLRALFPSSTTLGETIPVGSPAQSFALETVLTFALVLVVISVIASAQPLGSAALAVGSVVALDALVGGPVSGASMNPARSLGPAVVAGKYSYLWLYLAAPSLGSVLAVVAWGSLRPNGHASASIPVARGRTSRRRGVRRRLLFELREARRATNPATATSNARELR